MAFIDDFIALSEAKRADVQTLRAAVIDAIYALFLYETGRQILELSSESRDELQRLKSRELLLDGQIADIDAQTAVYVEREQLQREQRRALHRQHAKRHEAIAALRPVLRQPYEPACEWNCSLAGASPPWQWTWSDSSHFVPFSEMPIISARQWD